MKDGDITRDDDKAFILNPGEWPRWPVLPVKRYTKEHNGPECAVMAAYKTPPFRIYHKTLFELDGGRLKDVLGEKFTEYATIDDLLNDGWIPD